MFREETVTINVAVYGNQPSTPVEEHDDVTVYAAL